MKFVIQRVSQASVEIDHTICGQIGRGYLILIGIGKEDSRQTADLYIRKMLGLRIFADENGKTNLSLRDVGGGLLLVSQFTLYADCRKGNRPGFTDAQEPVRAQELYEYIIHECRKQVPVVQTGEFGADMQVSLCNDGPFTIILEGLEK